MTLPAGDDGSSQPGGPVRCWGPAEGGWHALLGHFEGLGVLPPCPSPQSGLPVGGSSPVSGGGTLCPKLGRCAWVSHKDQGSSDCTVKTPISATPADKLATWVSSPLPNSWAAPFPGDNKWVSSSSKSQNHRAARDCGVLLVQPPLPPPAQALALTGGSLASRLDEATAPRILSLV